MTCITKFNDFAAFRKVLDSAKSILVLTGAGVSAESGIPVFRGPGGLWRTYQATELATPEAFRRNPALVWEFYHYRRTVAFGAHPNKAHIALAKFEEEKCNNGRKFSVVTQNVDGLHTKAGSKNVLELHGALNKVRCLNSKCQTVEENYDNPIVEALRARGDPTALDGSLPEIDIDDLPKCRKCNALVRPHIVWFGEGLDNDVLNKTEKLVEECDLCLVIGTSMIVYPAAAYAPIAARAGKPVAEFNINPEPSATNFEFFFSGPCGISVPKALGYENLYLS